MAPVLAWLPRAARLWRPWLAALCAGALAKILHRVLLHRRRLAAEPPSQKSLAAALGAALSPQAVEAASPAYIPASPALSDQIDWDVLSPTVGEEEEWEELVEPARRLSIGGAPAPAAAPADAAYNNGGFGQPFEPLAWEDPPAQPEPPHVVCLLSSTTSSTSCCQSSIRELIDSGALQLLDAKCRLRLCSDLASGLQAIHAQGSGTGWHGMIRDDTCFVVREAGGLAAKLSVCDALYSAESASERMASMRGWWPAEAAELIREGHKGAPLFHGGQRMDIFGLGTVTATVMMGGVHPYGPPQEQQRRIETYSPHLTRLAGRTTALLPFLLRMLGSPPSRRPEAAEVFGVLSAASEAAPTTLSSGGVPAVQTAPSAAQSLTDDTPLGRAVAAVGGLDCWHQLDQGKRRAEVERACEHQHQHQHEHEHEHEQDKPESEEEEEEEVEEEDASSQAPFTAEAEAAVDDILRDIAAAVECPDESLAEQDSAEEAIDEFLAELAEKVEQEEAEVRNCGRKLGKSDGYFAIFWHI